MPVKASYHLFPLGSSLGKPGIPLAEDEVDVARLVSNPASSGQGPVRVPHLLL